MLLCITGLLIETNYHDYPLPYQVNFRIVAKHNHGCIRIKKTADLLRKKTDLIVIRQYLVDFQNTKQRYRILIKDDLSNQLQPKWNDLLYLTTRLY